MSAGDPDAADAALRTQLRQLHRASGLSYEQLAERANVARGTIGNYLTKPGHVRDRKILSALLDALLVSPQDREQALDLHSRTRSDVVGPAATGWAVRARTAGCTVWEMAEFTATEAKVHTAIGRHHTAVGSDLDMVPPRYVQRAHDPELRRQIAAAAAGKLQALIVLRGTSSTGKTRSLFEVVHELCPDWPVIRPRDAGAAHRLPASGLFDRRCVVWLNELQGFLGPNGRGLSLED